LALAAFVLSRVLAMAKGLAQIHRLRGTLLQVAAVAATMTALLLVGPAVLAVAASLALRVVLALLVRATMAALALLAGLTHQAAVAALALLARLELVGRVAVTAAMAFNTQSAEPQPITLVAALAMYSLPSHLPTPVRRALAAGVLDIITLT
jgi:hypothetical protein